MDKFSLWLESRADSYWMDSSGKIYDLPLGVSHEKWIERRMGQRKSVNDDPFETAFAKGWVRLVGDGTSLYCNNDNATQLNQLQIDTLKELVRMHGFDAVFYEIDKRYRRL